MATEQEQDALNGLLAWTLSLRDTDFIHQHVVDVWAAQHADGNAKPIGTAFALIGLYLHVEKDYTGKQVQRVHMHLGQPHGRGRGRKQWPRFPLPADRGHITVIDVMASPESERASAIDAWCRCVWECWRESHEQVRQWATSEGINARPSKRL